MTQGNQNTSGRALRRRVRLVTVGVVGPPPWQLPG